MVTVLIILIVAELIGVVAIWTMYHDEKGQKEKVLAAYNKLKRRHAQVLLSKQQDDNSGNKLMACN
jgi:uncharacterized oligopeptide transporter (OPT) family protein